MLSLKMVICFTGNNQTYFFEIRAILLSTHPNFHLSDVMAQQALSDFIFLNRKYQELSNDVYFTLVHYKVIACPLMSTSLCLICPSAQVISSDFAFLKESNITFHLVHKSTLYFLMCRTSTFICNAHKPFVNYGVIISSLALGL